MALITIEQSQDLWDNATKKSLEYVNGVYSSTRVHSKMDGFEYYMDSVRDSVAVTESSTPAEIETATIAYFQTLTYLGTDPIGKSVPF